MKNAEIQLEDPEILSPRTSTIKEIVEEINIRVADRQLTVDRIALQLEAFWQEEAAGNKEEEDSCEMPDKEIRGLSMIQNRMEKGRLIEAQPNR